MNKESEMKFIKECINKYPYPVNALIAARVADIKDIPNDIDANLKHFWIQRR